MKSIDDELREQEKWLEKLPPRQPDGYRLPEGYFENLEAEIFKKIDAAGERRRPVPQPRPAGWWTVQMGGRWQPRVAMAAAAVLVLGLATWWLLRSAPAKIETQPLASIEISEEEIENYVVRNVHQFDPEQLAPELVEVTAPELPANAERHLDNLKPEEIDNLIEELSDSELEELL